MSSDYRFGPSWGADTQLYNDAQIKRVRDNMLNNGTIMPNKGNYIDDYPTREWFEDHGYSLDEFGGWIKDGVPFLHGPALGALDPTAVDSRGIPTANALPPDTSPLAHAIWNDAAQCWEREPISNAPSAFDTQEGGQHYKDLDPQPAQVMRKWKVPHLEGEAIYRILRHERKNGAEDIRKAIHTLELILELDYAQSKS